MPCNRANQNASVPRGLEVIVLSCPIVFDRVKRAWNDPSLNVTSLGLTPLWSLHRRVAQLASTKSKHA